MRNSVRRTRTNTAYRSDLLGLAVAIASGLLISTCSAATWSGINAGLPAAVVRVGSIVIVPKTPSTIYARTFGSDGSGAIFKSTDGATSWKAISSIVGVNAVVVDPQSSSVVYALTGRGIVKSANGGDSWAVANAGLPASYISSLVIDPVTTSNLFAATGRGVFKSTNGGDSWNPLTGLPPNASINNLVVDPAVPSTLFAIGFVPSAPPAPPGPPASRVFKSVDGGDTWNALNPGLPPNASLGSLAIAAQSTIYALGSLTGASGPLGQALFKSTDGGVGWTILDTGLPSGATILSLALDPKDAAAIYVVVLFPFAEAGGILKSADGGKSWRALSLGLPANSPIQYLAIDPVTSSTIYVIAAGSVYKSTDGGIRWSKSTAGLTAVNVGVVAVNNSDAATVYTGSGDSMFKSVDNGTTWSKLFTFQITSSPSPFIAPPFPLVAPAYIRSLLIDFSNPNTLYAATYRPNGCYFADNLLFKSTDGGASWSDSVSPDKSGCVLGGVFGPSAGLKAIDPTDPNTLYLAETDDEDGGWWLLRSRDGGATWNPIAADFLNNVQAGVWSLAVDSSNPATLYAGLDDVPMYSDEGGIQPGAGGVFKSTDGGIGWKKAGLSGAAVNLLIVDPAQPSVLYAATAGNYGMPRGFRGLFKSTDSGGAWSAAYNGLAGVRDLGANMTALAIDPANSNRLYAGTSGGGVFRSSDGGANWSRFNDGLANLDVRSLAIAPGSRHVLYAGTSGGVFRITDDTP